MTVEISGSAYQVQAAQQLIQAGLRSIWEKYYEAAHAVINVVDANTHPDLRSQNLYLVLRHQDLQGAPVLLLPDVVEPREHYEYSCHDSAIAYSLFIQLSTLPLLC